MKNHLLILVGLFLVIGLFLFGNTLFYYFIADDFVWLYNAKYDTYAHLLKYAFDAEGFFYRPFTKLYFFFMWRWFGVEPFAYHVVNLLLHTVNSLVVYLLSFQILKEFYLSQNKRNLSLISLGSALLFFVHPIHQENILWISAVTELFPAMFLLVALYIFVTKLRTAFSFWYSLVFYLLFVLALMSHEYVVIFPIIVFVTDYFISRSIGEVLSRKFVYLGLIIVDAIYLIIRAQSNAHWSGGDYSYNLVKLPFNMIGNLFGYVGLNVVGVPFIYVYQNMREILRGQLALTGIILTVILGATIYVIYLLKRNYQDVKWNIGTPWLFLYSSIFFSISLLPFLGLGGIAERYLYLPSFAFLLIVSVFSYWVISYFDIPNTQYTNVYIVLLCLICSYYVYNSKVEQSDWKIASDFVYSRLGEFRDNCSSFSEGETITRMSPPNRQGRAWVFQVGYEHGANVLCDKNIMILLK